MIRITHRLTSVLIVLGSLATASLVFAACPPNQLPNPFDPNCTGVSVNDVVTKIINFIFVFATPICVIMVLWGGFEMMTSAGDPEKFSTGRKTILYAAVGFVVVLLANSVATLIQSIFK